MEFSNTPFYKRLNTIVPPQFHFLISDSFFRFLVVGSINTLLDLLIFNLVIFLLVLSSFETELVLGKAIGFFIASANSYVLNARFTFKKGLHKGDSKTVVAKKYGIFIAVSLIGALINVFVMFGLFRACIVFAPSHEVLIANVATLGATGISLIWNFLAYRKFVFT